MTNVGVPVSHDHEMKLFDSLAVSPAADDDREGPGELVTSDPYPSVEGLVIPLRTRVAGTSDDVQADHPSALMP